MGRWTSQTRRDVVLRLLGGESIQQVSRETQVSVARLEDWRRRALKGMEAGLRSKRPTDPLQLELALAQRRLQELSSSNRQLQERMSTAWARTDGEPVPTGTRERSAPEQVSEA